MARQRLTDLLPIMGTVDATVVSILQLTNTVLEGFEAWICDLWYAEFRVRKPGRIADPLLHHVGLR